MEEGDRTSSHCAKTTDMCIFKGKVNVYEIHLNKKDRFLSLKKMM